METYYILALKDCAYLFGFITILIVINIVTIKMMLSMFNEVRVIRDDNTDLKNENDKMNNKMNRIKHNPIPSHIKDAYINSQINSNAECAICLDEIDSINSSHLTNCGHLFHIACFNKIRMVRNKRKCPTCRT